MSVDVIRPAIRRSADHHYTMGTETVPGVTSILKVVDKSGALMSWAARNTAEAAVAMADKLPGMLEAVGAEGVVKALTARSEWKRDEAANLGTEVHRLADMVVRGEPTPSMPESVRTRVLAYAKWWQASGWTLRLSEAFVWNGSAGYGGTFDLLARDPDGRTVLADVKTGKGVYRETILQLAAYGMAEYVAPMSSAVVYPMPKPDRYAVLHVTADAVREIEVAVTHVERGAFLSCVDLYAWTQAAKGRL